MNNNKNRIWWILAIVLVIFSIGLIIAKKSGLIGKEDEKEVEVFEVKKTDLTETVSASGKIQPETEVSITPDVPGEIIGLYVKEGQAVNKGQLLLKIQPENYLSVVDRFKAGVDQSKASTLQSKASIAKAQSQLLRAENEYKRQKLLYDQKVISQSDLQTAETNYKVAQEELQAANANFEGSQYAIKSAQANLKDAQENLRKTNIYSPMNGIVSMLAVENGERVVGTSQMSGTEMLRIADLNDMEVRVNVNENDIVRVAKGDTAIIEVDAYSSQGLKFKGIITQIANTANSSLSSTNAAANNSTESVTEFEVRIKILPESYRTILSSKYPFKPGMTSTVDIITETKKNVLTVPISAVTTRIEGQKMKQNDEESDEEAQDEQPENNSNKEPMEVVFVYENGVAKMRQVKTGITDTSAGTIEIISGLKEGDKVISGPFIEISKRLNDGDKVKIKQAEKEKADKK